MGVGVLVLLLASRMFFAAGFDVVALVSLTCTTLNMLAAKSCWVFIAADFLCFSSAANSEEEKFLC